MGKLLDEAKKYSLKYLACVCLTSGTCLACLATAYPYIIDMRKHCVICCLLPALPVSSQTILLSPDAIVKKL